MPTNFTVAQAQSFRTCRACGFTGLTTSFYRRSGGYYRYECTPCWRRGQAERRRQSREEDPSYIERLAHRYSNVQSRALHYGHAFTLTKEQFAALINQPCGYCGGATPKTSGGLDRMDNTRGYELDNVIPCCVFCNKLKGARFTADEMHLLGATLRLIRERRNQAGVLPYHNGKGSPRRRLP